MKISKVLFLLMAAFIFESCSEVEDAADIQETAQQIGDVMASVDESGGDSNGTMAFNEGQRRFIARREQKVQGLFLNDVFSFLNPVKSSEAAACSTTSFDACDGGGQRVRNLNSCTIGSAIFTGDVTLTFSNPCSLSMNGDSVDREPNFTVTGRRGATLTVTKSGASGQTITRTGVGQFTFANDGIRRVFTLSGETLFDYTTSTTSNILVTGTSRANRVMDGGNLRILNNRTAVTCNYVPNDVTWSSTCNCASSGSWTGSCSDGKTTAVQITGCGTATISMADESEDFSFDRCYSN
jgi:hypothetical protein